MTSKEQASPVGRLSLRLIRLWRKWLSALRRMDDFGSAVTIEEKQIIAKHHASRRNFVSVCPLSTRPTPRTYTLHGLSLSMNNE
jgi:hypothetical protein